MFVTWCQLFYGLCSCHCALDFGTGKVNPGAVRLRFCLVTTMVWYIRRNRGGNEDDDDDGGDDDNNTDDVDIVADDVNDDDDEYVRRGHDDDDEKTKMATNPDTCAVILETIGHTLTLKNLPF